MSTLILYEDKYYETLHALIKRLRRERGAAPTVLEASSVRGDGGFARELGPALGRKLSSTRQRPDRVICVADADRPENLVGDAAPRAPDGADRDELDRWVRDLEGRWLERLRRDAKLDDEQLSRTRVGCLRWSKESVVIASPGVLERYAGDRRSELQALLSRCEPDPRTVPDEEFLGAYDRSPARCVDAVVERVRGERYKKGRHDEDILSLYLDGDRASRDRAYARLPDLARLIDAVV
jgi:hypothetical protein